MTLPILQFGTGRFLQAHVDLFVSQALARGEALGGIAVVQTTGSAQSTARTAALAGGAGYAVEVRGLLDGRRVSETVRVDSVRQAWHADTHWPQVMASVATDVRVIVSNTGERGYTLDPADGPSLLSGAGTAAPRSFPAKLAVLLYRRWRHQPGGGPSLFPCELVPRNGDTLRAVVCELAKSWQAPASFIDYLHDECVWVNSLVDRIVSEPLVPVGAVAEPYALWAIERQRGMVLPCTHPAIVLTDELGRFERLKLMLLNLGHTFLAERWLADGRPRDETVLQAMSDASLRAELEAVWNDEAMPVFDALGEGREARDYLVVLRDRLLNPFLAHRLADIAQNHASKKQARIGLLLSHADKLGLPPMQRRLRTAMATVEELHS